MIIFTRHSYARALTKSQSFLANLVRAPTPARAVWGATYCNLPPHSTSSHPGYFHFTQHNPMPFLPPDRPPSGRMVRVALPLAPSLNPTLAPSLPPPCYNSYIFKPSSGSSGPFEVFLLQRKEGSFEMVVHQQLRLLLEPLPILVVKEPDLRQPQQTLRKAAALLHRRSEPHPHLRGDRLLERVPVCLVHVGVPNLDGQDHEQGHAQQHRGMSQRGERKFWRVVNKCSRDAAAHGPQRDDDTLYQVLISALASKYFDSIVAVAERRRRPNNTKNGSTHSDRKHNLQTQGNRKEISRCGRHTSSKGKLTSPPNNQIIGV